MHSGATLTADGNGVSFATNERPMTIIGQGTWGGGTGTLQVSADGGTTWVPMSPTVALTANGAVQATLPRGLFFRIALTGSTNPSLKFYFARSEEN
jgi:hypothetical protein